LLENQQQQQQQHQQKDFTTYLIVGKGYIAGAIENLLSRYRHRHGSITQLYFTAKCDSKNRIETVLN